MFNIIQEEDTAVLFIDMQEKFIPAMSKTIKEEMVKIPEISNLRANLKLMFFMIKMNQFYQFKNTLIFFIDKQVIKQCIYS